MESITFIVLIISAILGLTLVKKKPVLALAMLWVVGVFKAYASRRFSVFDTFDLTALVVFIIATLMVFNFRNLSRNKIQAAKPFLVLHFAYAGLMILSLTWTSAPDYGLFKTYRFGIISTISFLAPMVLCKRADDLKPFVWVLLAFATLFSIAILFFPTYEIKTNGVLSTRPSAFESNPLNPAFVIAVSASLLLLPKQFLFLNLWPKIALFVLFVTAIYVSGCRSMFMQPFIALMILGVWGEKRQRRRAILLIGVLSMFLLNMFVFYGVSDPAERIGGQSQRISEFVKNPLGSFQHSGRAAMWTWALKNTYRAPILGAGAGAFATDFHGNDVRSFPHNIYVESLYEQGIVGFLILPLLTGLALISFLSFWKTNQPSSEFKSLCSVWIAVSTAALAGVIVHWDVADNRLLWSLFGINIFLLSIAKSRQTFPGIDRQ